jgi:formylmethanofuran dehydrogenase subunit C
MPKINSFQIRNKSLKSEDFANSIVINDDSSASGSFVVNGHSGLLISSSADTGNVVIAGNVPVSELNMSGLTDSILITGSSISLHGDALYQTGDMFVTGSIYTSGDTFEVEGIARVVGDMFVTGTIYTSGDVFEVVGTSKFMGNIKVAEAQNMPLGKVQLNGLNLVSISNNLVSTSSHVFLQKQSCNTPDGIVRLTVGNGSFQLSSTSGSDSDWVSYLVINKA